MEIEAKIDIKEENDIIRINLSGEKMGVIIGYRGETLDSIQYLVSLVVNKVHELPHKKVILDTENYRNKREETLKGVAIKTANKVKKTSKVFKLEDQVRNFRSDSRLNDISTGIKGIPPLLGATGLIFPFFQGGRKMDYTEGSTPF